MNKRILLALTFLTTCLVSVSLPCHAADQVVLKNGDRVSGELIGVSNNRVSIKTQYAGILLIKQNAVATITTETEFTQINRDGSQKETMLSEDEAVQYLMIVRKANPFDVANVRDWEKRLDVAAHSSTGNADVRSYTIRGTSKLSKPKTEQTVTVLFEQEITDGHKNKDKLDAKYGVRFLRNNGWFATTNLDFLEDTPKEIRNRTVFGFGGGRKLWDHSQGTFTMEAAASGVYESRTADSITSPALRVGAEYKKVLFGGLVEAFHNDRLLWIVDDTKGVLDSSNGVRLNLSNQFNLSFRTDVSYETQPHIETSTTDVTYAVGMGLNF